MYTKSNDKTNQKTISTLADEIKKILVEEIKVKKSDYKYISLSDLKDKSIIYLPTEMQSYAIALYRLIMNPCDEAYEYKMLLNIYNDLNS